MRKTKKSLIVSALLLTGFALWTAAVCFVDVRYFHTFVKSGVKIGVKIDCKKATSEI